MPPRRDPDDSWDPDAVPPPPAWPRLVALGIALCFVLAYAVRCARILSRAATVRAVTTVASDVAFAEGSWSVVEELAASPARVRSMTTSFDPAVDGREKYALVMPPPCAVRLEVPEGAGERGRLVLRASAGVGLRFQPPAGSRCTIVFTVEVDGDVVEEQRVALGDGDARDWRPIGGPDGVAFERGDEVVLRTSIEGCEGVEGAEAAPAGFGELRIEEVVRKTDPLPADPEHPSVVLIVVDTLRADHLSCLGSERAPTPNVDALAARGVLYERAYATSPWTWPSTASILTGLAPERHGVLDGRSCVLSSDNETLAEVFFERDWFTGGFSGNPLVDSMRRFDQGFETWDSFNQFRFTSALMPQITAWIDAHAGQRFFLYLHLVDPHAAYDNRPEALAQVGGARPDGYPAGNALKAFEERLFENEGRGPGGAHELARVVPPDHERWMRDEYQAGVLTADLWLGDVLAQLERLGIADRTVVAFTSDHGEELGDHGLVAHCSQLHEELVRVPLVIAGPGIPAGRRVTTPVSNRHLAPTLARLAGATLRSIDDPLDLLDARALETGTCEERPVFVSTHNGRWDDFREVVSILGVVEHPWTLHYTPSARAFGEAEDAPGRERVRLFDLERDPDQLRDVSAAEPERVERLKRLVLTNLHQNGEGRPAISLGAGEETLQLLREIGYAGDGADATGGAGDERHGH